MDIRVETTDLLVLEDRPWFFGLTLVFFVTILSWACMANFAAENYGTAGLVAAFVTIILIVMRIVIKRTLLVFDRAQGTLSIATRSYGDERFVTHRLTDLNAALVQSMHSDDSTAYRVALHLVDGMDAGIYPVTNIYSSGDGAMIASRAINRWLAVPLDSRPAPY